MYIFILVTVFNALVGGLILYFAWNYVVIVVLTTVKSVDFLGCFVVALFIMWLRGNLIIRVER